MNINNINEAFSRIVKEEFDNQTDANKTVIYKDNGVYKTTSKANYDAQIQDAREIHTLHDFESAREIMDYYNKYFNTTDSDFIILDETIAPVKVEPEKKERAPRRPKKLFEDGLYDEVYARLSDAPIYDFQGQKSMWPFPKGKYDSEKEIGFDWTDSDIIIKVTTEISDDRLGNAKEIAKEYNLKTEYVGPNNTIGKSNEMLKIYIPIDAPSPFDEKRMKDWEEKTKAFKSDRNEKLEESVSHSFKIGDTFKNINKTFVIDDIKGDYALVHSDELKFHPYIVAWSLSDDGSWGQGHYFITKEDAEEFFNEKTINESISSEDVIDLDYKDLEVTLASSEPDPDKKDYVDYKGEYSYSVDKDSVLELLLNELVTDDDVKDFPGGLDAIFEWGEGVDEYIDSHFDDLVNKYYDDILEYYREKAEDAFAEEYGYDDYMQEIEDNRADMEYHAWRDSQVSMRESVQESIDFGSPIDFGRGPCVPIVPNYTRTIKDAVANLDDEAVSDIVIKQLHEYIYQLTDCKQSLDNFNEFWLKRYPAAIKYIDRQINLISADIIDKLPSKR